MQGAAAARGAGVHGCWWGGRAGLAVVVTQLAAVCMTKRATVRQQDVLAAQQADSVMNNRQEPRTIESESRGAVNF